MADNIVNEIIFKMLIAINLGAIHPSASYDFFKSQDYEVTQIKNYQIIEGDTILHSMDVQLHKEQILLKDSVNTLTKSIFVRYNNIEVDTIKFDYIEYKKIN